MLSPQELSVVVIGAASQKTSCTRTGPAGHSERRSRNREKTEEGKLNLNVTMLNFRETVGDTLNLNVAMQNFQETVGDTLNLNGIGRKRATVDRTKAPVEVKCMKSTEAIVVHRTGMLSVIANLLPVCYPLLSTDLKYAIRYR